MVITYAGGLCLVTTCIHTCTNMDTRTHTCDSLIRNMCESWDCLKFILSNFPSYQMNQKGGLKTIQGTIRVTWELHWLPGLCKHTCNRWTYIYNMQNHKCAILNMHTDEPHLPLSFSLFYMTVFHSGSGLMCMWVCLCDTGLCAYERLTDFCILLNQYSLTPYEPNCPVAHHWYPWHNLE